MVYSHRWWFSIPFLIAIAVLVSLVWAVSLGIWYPYNGLPYITIDGLVKSVDPNGPAYSLVEEEDRIVDIDGLPYSETTFFYAEKSPGDLTTIRVIRGRDVQDIQVTLAYPSQEELIDRLAPLLVASIFWVIGVGVQALKPAKDVSNVFFLFFQATAVFLIAGSISSLGPTWINIVLRFLIWVIGPLAFHFHLHFPQTSHLPGQKAILWLLYTFSIGFGLLYIVTSEIPELLTLGTIIQFSQRIFLAGCFAAVVMLLLFGYQHSVVPGARSKIRIVVLGGIISLLPLISLIIIPEALLKQFLIPYSYAIIFLGILPLTYGYAIFRYRLIEIERHVNRGATLVLVYFSLVVIYLLLYFSLDQILAETVIKTPLINSILVLALASVFIPLHRSVQRFVDIVFYGGWYDYRSAISKITGGLEQITELRTLAQTTSTRLVETLRVEEVCVFLADLNGNFTIQAVSPLPTESNPRKSISHPLPRSSLDYLLSMGKVVERNALRTALAEVSLSPQEVGLLESEQSALWVPVIGHGEMIGYMALGSKFGGDPFSDEDIDILLVVSRQLSPLIENLHLVTRLRDYASELEKRVTERTIDLANAKKRLEAILASVGEGVIVTNLQDEVERVNDTFLRQSNYRDRETRDCKLWEFYDIADLETKLADIDKAVRADGIWSGELIGLRRDGSKYDVFTTITSLQDETGKLIGYVTSQRDITQQKELDRLKDMFVSDVSHELRTPTTNIGLYIELLENATHEKQKYYLNVLKEQSNLLIRLVEDILDLSRLSTRKHKPKEFDIVNLNGLSEQVILTHKPMAVAAGLKLSFEPDLDLPVVLGEPSQLIRVISNLVTNAIHYTREGSVIVRTYHDNRGVYLDVIDTGMGIDLEDQQHLFERFYRGRQVRQSRIPGTGLGLAIVKEIIERHSSQISIKSEEGKGSTFSIAFPLVSDDVWAVKSY